MLLNAITTISTLPSGGHVRGAGFNLKDHVNALDPDFFDYGVDRQWVQN